jgi:hypothetical protein
VIDLFYAQDIHSLGGVVNIKLKRYSALPFKTIFILVGNKSIDIGTVRTYLARRKIPIPHNILVDTEVNFKTLTIDQLKALSEYSR